MSLDPSLKTSGGLIKHRNVLRREERIAKLTQSNKFDPDSSDPIHLPKVASRKIATGKKTSKKDKAAEEGKG